MYLRLHASICDAYLQEVLLRQRAENGGRLIQVLDKLQIQHLKVRESESSGHILALLEAPSLLHFPKSRSEILIQFHRPFSCTALDQISVLQRNILFGFFTSLQPPVRVLAYLHSVDPLPLLDHLVGSLLLFLAFQVSTLVSRELPLNCTFACGKGEAMRICLLVQNLCDELSPGRTVCLRFAKAAQCLSKLNAFSGTSFASFPDCCQSRIQSMDVIAFLQCSANLLAEPPRGACWHILGDFTLLGPLSPSRGIFLQRRRGPW
mmetsp:Transcript_11054/g.19709  ORF Transcript_11054/g.19709 Transcript_11054/m.19709 type:complete len:263 (-) Transcript_11054:512-1300(-)